jgi:hypothetical protein
MIVLTDCDNGQGCDVKASEIAMIRVLDSRRTLIVMSSGSELEVRESRERIRELMRRAPEFRPWDTTSHRPEGATR